MQQENGLASRVSTERDRPPRVLIANDQEIWIWSLETILAPEGYSVIRATTAAQVLEQAAAAEPDVVILHSTLKDATGLELCRELHQKQLISPAAPVIVTTSGPCRRGDRLQVLRAGGWEYASLPLDAEELIARLRVYLAAKKTSDRAYSEGLIDPLTGLYDLRGILTRVRELGLAARRHARALGCATVSCAPESGSVQSVPALFSESVLQSPAPHRHAPDVLRTVVRGSDIVGRLGPNEFVILAPETAVEGMLQLADRLVAAFEAESLVPGAGTAVRVGCYAVADFAAVHMDPMEMIVRSTQALRRAQLPGAPPIQEFTNESPS